MIKKYISTFLPLLKPLLGDNLVLAGTLALKYHGLKMSREANDLDVVIFNPTEEQLSYLESIAFFQQRGDNFLFERNEIFSEDYSFADLKQRSFKFKRNDLFIDILLANNQRVPDDLLFLIHENFMWPIQRIDLNIEAKCGYINEFNDSNGIKNDFSRTKDVLDLLDLKNSNFNLNRNTSLILFNNEKQEYPF